MTIKQCRPSNALLPLLRFLLRKTESEKCYLNNIRPLFALVLLCFYSKVCLINKKPEKIQPRYTKIFFIDSRNKKINETFLTLTKLTSTILDKYWHSVNLCYCKLIPVVYLEHCPTSIIKFFCDFLKKNSTVDVLLGFKYTSAYLHWHAGQSHRNYRHIEYFRCKI